MRRLWIALLLLAALGFSGCSSTPEAKVGDPAIFSNWSMPKDLSNTEFQIPTGTVTISIGQPVTDDVQMRFDSDDLTAPPDQGSFLPIRMDFRAVAGRTGTEAEQPSPMSAALIADGRTYQLPNAYEVVDGELTSGPPADGWYLPISGQVAAQSLAVTYDGLTQTFDLTTGERDAGAAAIWYGQQEPTLRDCPNSDWTGELANIVEGNCYFLFGRAVPYFADLGWAAPGHRWLVLFVATDPVLGGPGLDEKGFTADGLDPFDVEQDSLAVVINDGGPVGSAGTSGPFVYNSVPGSDSYQIFDVAQGPVTVDITATVTVDYLPDGDGDETTSTSGDITLTLDFELE